MEIEEILSACTGFQWDTANSEKNWRKHGVSSRECEEVFLNVPFFVDEDIKHSSQEHRFYGLGQTDLGRALFIVFTVRNQQIRIISARDMHRKERIIYGRIGHEENT